MNTGHTLQMAKGALVRAGFDGCLRPWFDETDNTISVTLTADIRKTLTAEQLRALEAVCRLLKLKVPEAPSGGDGIVIAGEATSVDTHRTGSEVSAMFGQYYSENRCGNSETVSGNGSTLEQTHVVHSVLPTLLADLGAISLLDLPCGDFHWMRHVPLDAGIHYLGADVVEPLVARNQQLFGSARVRFLRLDVLGDRIPPVDLILCRDCLVHLPEREIRRALVNLCRSGSQWLLTTTFPGRRSAKDIALGQWRPLNLEAEPFCLPPPVRLIVERCTEGNGRFADKSLGLWHLHDVANVLECGFGLDR